MTFSGYTWGPIYLIIIIGLSAAYCLGFPTAGGNGGRTKHQRAVAADSSGLNTPQLLISSPQTPNLASPQHHMPINHHTSTENVGLTSSHLDVATNSVGLLLTTLGGGEEEVLHVWLPIGRKVYTHDDMTLPTHPVTARITTMIRSSPRIATPEHLDRVVCDIYPRFNSTDESEAHQGQTDRHISLSKADDLVRLQDVSAAMKDAGIGDGLTGGVWPPWKEVEAYKCDWHPAARLL